MFRYVAPVPRRFGRTLATDASSPTSETSRRTWARQEIQDLYDSPLLDLVFRAASVHRQHHDPSKIQLCTLMNIKTGGCTEDCSYCSQSSPYSTPTTASRLVELEPVLEAARKAKENGSTRFSMGAALRDLAGRKRGFERILEMVREVRGMGMEVCTTLGMLSPDMARQLKEAGLTAYNHNLDTSREFYPQVITTRSYDERLETITAVRDAGISICSGGIPGLPEEESANAKALHIASELQLTERADAGVRRAILRSIWMAGSLAFQPILWFITFATASPVATLGLESLAIIQSGSNFSSSNSTSPTAATPGQTRFGTDVMIITVVTSIIGAVAAVLGIAAWIRKWWEGSSLDQARTSEIMYDMHAQIVRYYFYLVRGLGFS